MCGIIGVVGTHEAARESFLGLITLQHRGQDAAGILSMDFASASEIHVSRNLGLVEKIFSKEAIESLKGAFAVGHTRYSTAGQGDLAEVQPLLINYPYGIGIAHNGNIVNYLELKDRLQREHRARCLTGSDTETILNWIAHNLKGTAFDEIAAAVESVFENVKGSYSIVGLIADAGLIAFRDPHGIRPLVLGRKAVEGGVAAGAPGGVAARAPGGATAYMVASETSPLSFLGYEFVRDVEPGELLFIDREFKLHSRVLRKAATAPHDMRRKEQGARPCMFEWVYFAGAESVIEGAPVYGTRLELGRSLGRILKEKIARGEIEADLVTPVPDTARPAATAIAEELGIPYRDVLIKNRYITRTFILGSQSKREKAVDLKLHPIMSEIRGKCVVLVDDSIVRGTTSRKIVQLVRKAGARKVVFVSTCPPIRFPCFYGIDFPDRDELIAGDASTGAPSGKPETALEKRVAGEIGADAVIYQTMEGLKQSLARQSGGRVARPCLACLEGEYPTDVSEAARFTEQRKSERREGERRANGVAHGE
ncbi:MAG: amidophosphoribosyltransferase [Deltaproteobacteria bacterium]|nr:amidophosphoribosyltransferase [Deltaproteobacteria bacterium]